MAGHAMMGGVAAALAMVASPAAADDVAKLSFGLTVDYARGHYGEAVATDILTVPLSLRWSRGDWVVRAALPWQRVAGPASIAVDPAGPAQGAGRRPDDGIVHGFGDLGLAVEHSIGVTAHLDLDLAARLKLPTASVHKQLGTGLIDVTAEAGLTETIGRWTLWAAGARKLRGSSSRFPIRDVWQASAGLSRRIGARSMIDVDYLWRQAALRNRQPISEATVTVSRRIDRHLRIGIYGSRGFTANSVDWSSGITIAWRISLG